MLTLQGRNAGAQSRLRARCFWLWLRVLALVGGGTGTRGAGPGAGQALQNCCQAPGKPLQGLSVEKDWGLIAPMGGGEERKRGGKNGSEGWRKMEGYYKETPPCWPSLTMLQIQATQGSQRAPFKPGI